MYTSIQLLVLFLSLAGLLTWRLVKALWQRRAHEAVECREHVVTEKDPYQDIEPLHDFDWATMPAILQRPFKPKYHLTMGLENITFSELIAMDNTYVDRMRVRRKIMDEHLDSTVQCNPVAESACLELFDWTFCTYLVKRFPRIYQLLPDGQSIRNTVSDEYIPSRPRSALAALRTLGDHVDTDYLVLFPSSTTADGSPIYHLEAFVTCFPAGFSTRAKLGLPLAEIHAPVPGYKAKLEKSMDRFFAKLECGRVVKRTNWALTTDDRLFSQEGLHLYEGGAKDDGKERRTQGDEARGASNVSSPGADGDNLKRQKASVVIEDCRVRSERQTLFRLPKTKALVFAFKTYQYRLEDIKAEGNGSALAEAIEGLAKGSVPEMNYYKRAVVWREKVLEYLRS